MSILLKICLLVVIMGHLLVSAGCVMDGTPVVPKNSWPFIVHAHLKNTILHGVIIDEYTILTGSWRGLQLRTDTFSAGKYYSDRDEDTQQVRRVCAHAAHPNSHNQSIRYSWSIVRLEEPFTFNRYVQPVELAPYRDSRPTSDCLILGWGFYNKESSWGSGVRYLSTVLRERSMQILPDFNCPPRKDDSKHFSVICATKGMCEDWGAPVICQFEGTYVLYGMGIVTYVECTYGLLSSITEMPRDWFEETIAGLEEICQPSTTSSTVTTTPSTSTTTTTKRTTTSTKRTTTSTTEDYYYANANYF